MRPFGSIISIDEARRLLADHVQPIQRAERVPLAHAAGRVAAAEVKSSIPVPPFSRSLMDGYAVIASDTSGAASSVTLEIVDRIYTGAAGNRPITSGRCAEIATGAPIPEGDYELRLEHFERTSCSQLIDPYFVHSLTPEGVLQPGATTVRFDIGPLPAGLSDSNPIATRISSLLYAPEPVDTDECCFSWRASPHPLHRESIPSP